MKNLPARVSRYRLLWEWLLDAIAGMDSKLKERSFYRHRTEFYGALKRTFRKWFAAFSAHARVNAIKRNSGKT